MSDIIVLLSVFTGDFFLKKYVEAALPDKKEIPILGKRIVVRKCHNSGIAGGGLADHTRLIEKGTLCILLLLGAYEIALFFQKGRRVERTGLALLMGGGLSNWYDRYRQGYVTDYFSFRSRKGRLGRLVFNLSDFCIFFGTALALPGALKNTDQKK